MMGSTGHADITLPSVNYWYARTDANSNSWFSVYDPNHWDEPIWDETDRRQLTIPNVADPTQIKTVMLELDFSVLPDFNYNITLVDPLVGVELGSVTSNTRLSVLTWFVVFVSVGA